MPHTMAVHVNCQYVTWGARKTQDQDDLPSKRTHRAQSFQ